jgi:hypothetical protein
MIGALNGAAKQELLSGIANRPILLAAASGKELRSHVVGFSSR